MLSVSRLKVKISDLLRILQQVLFVFIGKGGNYLRPVGAGPGSILHDIRPLWRDGR